MILLFYCLNNFFFFYSADNTPGIIDSKGIELVRRDSCEILTKIMYQCIKKLFITKNLSNVIFFYYSYLDKIVSLKKMI